MIGSTRLSGRLVLASVAMCTAAASSARAQSLFDVEARVAPQFMSYQIHEPADETITELAIPVFVAIPAGSHLSVDVGTAYARARVTSGATRSEIAGLTETQIRGTYTFGGDFVVLTAGVSLPTGESTVTLEQLAAAGRIGNDFLSFPVSEMGTGLAATGGVARARPHGAGGGRGGLGGRGSRG